MRLHRLNKSLFTVLLVIIISVSMIITSFAYDSKWYLSFGDGTTRNLNGNGVHNAYMSASHPEQLTWNLINSDPIIFNAGYMYTFDVVVILEYADINFYQSQTQYQNCIIDLARNGFTTEWYSHYVFDATNIEAWYLDGSGQDHKFALGGIDESSDYQYYVSSDECVVGCAGTYYNGTRNDLIYNINGLGSQRLVVQQKIHFQFTTRDVLDQITLYWWPYSFGDLRQSEVLAEWGGAFQVSDMVVMDNSVAQAEVNILGSLANVSGQVTALQSTMDQLLEQVDYYYDQLTADWDLAINTYEPEIPEVEGILPQMYLYLWSIEDFVWSINSRVNTTNSRLTTTNNTLSTISTTTTTIQHLLDNRSNNFWTWLDENFTTIHEDLVDTNDYLDQLTEGLGLNDTETQTEIQSVSSQLASTEQSLTTITSSMVEIDGETFDSLATAVDDLTYMSGDNLNAAMYVFMAVMDGFNFSVGTMGILSLFLIYVIITKIWGQLFFDE